VHTLSYAADALERLGEHLGVYADHTTQEPEQTMYLLVGLSGEVGEMLNLAAKRFRRHLPPVTDNEDFAAEIGDVLWYLLRLCKVNKIALHEVIRCLEQKLQRRAAHEQPAQGQANPTPPPGVGKHRVNIMTEAACLAIGGGPSLLPHIRQVLLDPSSKASKHMGAVIDVVLWLLRSDAVPPSQPEIAQALGYRSHTSVGDRCRRIREDLRPTEATGPLRAAWERHQRLKNWCAVSRQHALTMEGTLPSVRLSDVILSAGGQIYRRQDQ